jgi:hypothetical protein
MRIEDEYFYALADRVLTPDERTLIASQFSGVSNRPVTGDRARYLKMLEEYPSLVASWTKQPVR